jgi:SAM-dependent methyltransferase
MTASGNYSLHDREVERIKIAFGHYDSDAREQAKRDPLNRGNRAIMRERQLKARDLLARFSFLPLADRRVLDVGCGRGGILASFLEMGARAENLYGVDLLPNRIEEARLSHPGMNFICSNAENLDYPDTIFDLVVLFTVFSSILDSGMARNVADEVDRVLKPGGALLWYDFCHSNPWNPHTRGITKRDLLSLFPAFELNILRITLVPPVARRLGLLTPLLYPLLVAIPQLRTHYLGLLVKPVGESKFRLSEQRLGSTAKEISA